jgi:hypothetical protein
MFDLLCPCTYDGSLTVDLQCSAAFAGCSRILQVYCGIQNVTAALNGTGPPTDTPPLQLPLYTCSTGPVMTDNGTWIPSTGTITPDSPTNASAVVFYNELATLMLNTGGLSSAVAALCNATLVISGSMVVAVNTLSSMRGTC